MEIRGKFFQQATCGQLIGNGETRFERVVIDSRLVQSGDLFVAISGQNQDGHAYVQQALGQGAQGVVVSLRWWKNNQSLQAPCILVVDDTQVALGQMAALIVAHRKKMGNFKVVAVTGSHGKTSTKELIASILAQHYGPLHVLKTEGNLNNQLGVPLTLLKIRQEHAVAVVELGMSFLGEISYLASLCRPDVSVVTGVGFAHLEELGSIEEIAKAKSELFYSLTPQGVAVFPVGRQKQHQLLKKEFEKIPHEQTPQSIIVTMDSDIEDAALQIGCEQVNLSGLTVSVLSNKKSDLLNLEKHRVEVYHAPLLGAHHAQNMGLAVAVAKYLGCSTEEINRGFLAVHIEKHRGRVVEINDRMIIDDCYNAAPDSVKAALVLLQDLSQEKRRTVAILGDMLELGIQEQQLHEQLVETILKTKLKQLILYGPRMAFLAKIANQYSIPTRHVQALDELVICFEELTLPLDIILVKGSRGMKLDLFIDQMMLRYKAKRE